MHAAFANVLRAGQLAAPSRAARGVSTAPSPKSPAAAVLVVRRRSGTAAQCSASASARAAFSSLPAAPSGLPKHGGASRTKSRRIPGGSSARSARGGPPPIAAAAASAPQPWPAATANVFPPPPQHFAAVAVSALKWLWAVAAIVLATDVARMQAFALGATASAAAAPWAPWALRALGSNLVMAAGCAAALQRLLETGLAPAVPAGPALAMGLLGAAAFRAVHLFQYRAAYAPGFFSAGIAVAGVASLVFVALLAHLSSERKKKPSSATLSPLAPASKGLPAAYSLVALLYVGIGLALQVLPGTVAARFFAAPSAASFASSPLAEALRAAVGSTLVFPASVGAWVLKDAAERGQLAWPSSRALNAGLLLSSLARVGVIAGAVASGNVVNAEALWQLPVGVHLAVALVAAAGLKSK
jgi:hypothetical protein